MSQPPFLLYFADDDEDDQSFVGEAFEKIGLSDVCRFFTGGAALLKELQNGRLPDMIILDYEMPGMDGRQLLRHLKSSPGYQHIPVVIHSDQIDGPLRTEMMDLGAANCISKGVTLNDQILFARAITGLLGK